MSQGLLVALVPASGESWTGGANLTSRDKQSQEVKGVQTGGGSETPRAVPVPASPSSMSGSSLASLQQIPSSAKAGLNLSLATHIQNNMN